MNKESGLFELGALGVSTAFTLGTHLYSNHQLKKYFKDFENRGIHNAITDYHYISQGQDPLGPRSLSGKNVAKVDLSPENLDKNITSFHDKNKDTLNGIKELPYQKRREIVNYHKGKQTFDSAKTILGIHEEPTKLKLKNPLKPQNKIQGLVNKAVKSNLLNYSKEANTAFDRFKTITDAGFLYAGNAKKYLARNIQAGKTPEQLGFVSLKNSDKKAIQDISPKGREYGIDVLRSGERQANKGVVGAVLNKKVLKKVQNAESLTDMEDITKTHVNNLKSTFHTHPYKGLNSVTDEDIIKSQFKIQGLKATKNNIKMALDMQKNLGVKPNAHVGLYENNNIHKAHPNPEIKILPNGLYNALKTPPGDIHSFIKSPNAVHNILNPESGVQGMHRVYNKGEEKVYKEPNYGIDIPYRNYKVRSVYRQIEPIKY